MQRRIGAVSRWTRALTGSVVLALVWWLDTPWGLLGLPLILSAAIGWCPFCQAGSAGR